MIKVILFGANGRMGREVIASAKRGNKVEIVAEVDPTFESADGVYTFKAISDCNVQANLIIDFSHHSLTECVLDYAAKRDLPVIEATTGHTPDELEVISRAAQKVALFRSGNMSLGVALLCDLAKRAASAFPDADIEIVETHHNRKLDAPSGTALMLAESIKQVRAGASVVYGRTGKRNQGEIGISSLRYGNIVGIHEVNVSTDNETITLKHEAHSRALFADGAVAVAEFMVGKSAGLYSMADYVK